MYKKDEGKNKSLKLLPKKMKKKSSPPTFTMCHIISKMCAKIRPKIYVIFPLRFPLPPKLDGV